VARALAQAARSSPQAQGVAQAPHGAGSELLELACSAGDGGEKAANVIFHTIQDRRGRSILSVRDQNTFDATLRRSA
jgi:hypothetical protein